MRRAEPKMLTVLLQYCFGYRVGIHPWSRVRMPPEASSLGMAGREAAERRHSLQAMRSRRSDKRPTAGCWDQWRRRDVACMAQKTKLFRMRVPSPDHFSCLWSRGEATPTDSTVLAHHAGTGPGSSLEDGPTALPGGGGGPGTGT